MFSIIWHTYGVEFYWMMLAHFRTLIDDNLITEMMNYQSANQCHFLSFLNLERF